MLGPLGALLAVPMTLLVRALLLDPDPRARWATVLISSNSAGVRPACTPVPARWTRPSPLTPDWSRHETRATAGRLPDIGVSAGLLVASAIVPGTFARSLSARSAVDQGIVTGLATGCTTC